MASKTSKQNQNTQSGSLESLAELEQTVSSGSNVASSESFVDPSADWGDTDTAQAMITELLAGTFDEQFEAHAENLAGRLLQRQEDLDRRETQLARWATELEKESRSLRLQKISLSEQEAPETTQITDDADVSVDAQETVLRFDRYCTAQRLPYSHFNTRLKKYGDADKNVAQKNSGHEHVQETDHVDYENSNIQQTFNEQNNSEQNDSNEQQEPFVDERSDVSEGASEGQLIQQRIRQQLAELRNEITEINQEESSQQTDEAHTHIQLHHSQEADQRNSLEPTSHQAQADSHMQSSLRNSIRQLSAQARALRQRGESMESVHNALSNTYAKMRHLHIAFQQIAKNSLAGNQKMHHSFETQTATALEELGQQIAQIGKHFPSKSNAATRAA